MKGYGLAGNYETDVVKLCFQDVLTYIFHVTAKASQPTNHAVQLERRTTVMSLSLRKMMEKVYPFFLE